MSNSNTSKNIKVLVFAIALLAVIIGITVLLKVINRIPDNDPTLVGNTGGNLNNGGYFCESDGKVYFANMYDRGYLYSMNPDQTNIKRLYNSNCSNINAGGNHLYFCMETPEGGTGLGFVIKTAGIYRSTKNGKKIKCLTNENTLTMNLIGSTLYYQANTGTGVGLKKMSIKGTSKPEIVEDSFVLNPASAANGSIFFGGTEDNHYLYSLNTANDSISPLWNGNVWNPVYEDGYFYYMDISDKYSICRYSPMNQTVDILTHDRADNFNVGYGYVYYTVSASDEPGLYRCRVDGSGSEKIASGYICDVNITSTYTYFREFEHETPIYYVSTTGSSYPTEFVAALDAASK